MAELQLLLPQYHFLRLIGRGGMGAVFEAIQSALNRRVAIKVLPTGLMQDVEANFTARFRLEAKTLARLSHPGIVAVFEAGEAGGFHYIVMEYVDGTDIARMLRTERRLDPVRTAALLLQVCDALGYAHSQGVIHRDVKPANLLVTRNGQIKIVDFGLARHEDDSFTQLTATHLAVGTVDFLAPEGWGPARTFDQRADLYSLGVTLYQLLTGELPRGLWEAPSTTVGVHPDFDRVITRALQPKPDSRYQSAAEFARDLEPLAYPATLTTPVVQAPAGPVARADGSERPSRRWWVLATCMALGCLAWVTTRHGGYWYRLWTHPPKPLARFSTPPVWLEFGSRGQAVSVENFAPLLPTDNVTVEFWSNPRAYCEAQSIFALEPDDVFNRFCGILAYADTNMYWDFGSITMSGRLVAPHPTNFLGHWVHYAFVADRAEGVLKIYTNSLIHASITNQVSKARSFGRLNIGGAGPGGIASFQGAIAEFRIWNRARSPLELRGTQYQRLSGREPGLLLYLPFDEGQGEIVTNWAIATGRDYNGVLFNSPQWSKQESSP